MSTELVVVDADFSQVAPVVSPADAKEAMRQYQELCEAVLSADDYQPFTQKKKVNGQWIEEEKKFKKKSAVKKLQTFFGVDVRVRETVRDDLGDGHFGFRVIATAQHKNGRVVEATGGCSTHEERFDLTQYGNEDQAKFEARSRKARARSYHDVLSTAETRATNRAVMNAIGVGGGEVTADEVQRQSSKPAEKPAFDRDKQYRKLGALIKDFAKVSPDGEALKDDEQRHQTLLKLYQVGSYKDLTDEQLVDFERRLRSQIEKAKAE